MLLDQLPAQLNRRRLVIRVIVLEAFYQPPMLSSDHMELKGMVTILRMRCDVQR